MGKFYVQSGSLKTIVQAESSRKAAIWAVHQAMQQVLPLDSAADFEGGMQPERDREFAVLSGVVRISQRGFDRDDATAVATLDVVTQWNEMVTTLDRLERMLYPSATDHSDR